MKKVILPLLLLAFTFIPRHASACDACDGIEILVEDYEEVEEWIEEWVEYGQDLLAADQQYNSQDELTDSEALSAYMNAAQLSQAVEKVKVLTKRIITISRTISILSTQHTCGAFPEPPPTPVEPQPEVDPNLTSTPPAETPPVDPQPEVDPNLA